jgi:hypothetical protein
VDGRRRVEVLRSAWRRGTTAPYVACRASVKCYNVLTRLLILCCVLLDYLLLVRPLSGVQEICMGGSLRTCTDSIESKGSKYPMTIDTGIDTTTVQ